MNFLQWINSPSKKALVVALILAAGIFIFHSWILSQIGSFLVIEKPLEKADVLIVLSGGEGERVDKAVKLYQDTVAPVLLMSGGGNFYGKNEADYMAEYALNHGVPSFNILLDREATSTYTNSTRALPIIQSHMFKRAIIVTSKYHTRRSLSIFKKVFRKASVDLQIVGCDDGIDYGSWWKNHDMAEAVLIEWAKTFIYWLKY